LFVIVVVVIRKTVRLHQLQESPPRPADDVLNGLERSPRVLASPAAAAVVVIGAGMFG